MGSFEAVFSGLVTTTARFFAFLVLFYGATNTDGFKGRQKKKKRGGISHVV